MNDSDSELKNILDATEMDARPDPARAEVVRQRMLNIAGRAGTRPHRHRSVLVAALVVIGVSGIGLAATETGRNFIRWIFTPVEEIHSTEWEAPTGEVWTQSTIGRSEPYSPEEEKRVAEGFAESYAAKQAGEGRLVGLIESPGWAGVSETVYLIEYEHEDGETTAVGSGRPTGKQAENLRIDEIMQLRDAGAGEIIEQSPFPIGMGRYTIRLTLSDGETVDLATHYPPGTEEERELVFAEMRELKAALRFTVLDAYFDKANPEAGVWGTLQYQLADGRTVGATEQLPPEIISEDGTQVVMPDVESPIAIEGAEGASD
jgi:hypothetical protein